MLTHTGEWQKNTLFVNVETKLNSSCYINILHFNININILHFNYLCLM